MKDFDIAALVAKDENFTVAEFAFFYRFFKRHGTQGDGVDRAHDVRLGDGRLRGKAVDGNGDDGSSAPVAIRPGGSCIRSSLLGSGSRLGRRAAGPLQQ